MKHHQQLFLFTGDDIAVALENFKNDIVKEKEGETLLEIDLEKVARIKKR